MALKFTEESLANFPPGCDHSFVAGFHENLRPHLLPTINCLRVVAAFHIISGHILEQTLLNADWPAWLVIMVCSSASTSTSLFFLMSGFVLAYSRHQRTLQTSRIDLPSPSPFAVFMSHAARGLTLMTLMVLLWIPIALVESHAQGWKVVGDALLSLSLLCPLVGHGPPFNGPAWAMTAFIFGYAVDAWFGRELQRMRLQTLWLLLIFLWLWQMLCNGLPLFNTDPDITIQPFPPRNFPPVLGSLHVFAALRLMEIVLGMVLSVLYCRSSAIGARRWPVRFGFPLFCAGAVAVMVLTHSGDGRLAFLASHGILTPLLALLLVAAASDTGPIAWLGRTRCGRHLAEGTLALYLMHMPVHHYVCGFFTRVCGIPIDLKQIPWWYLCCYITILLIGCLVSARPMRWARRVIVARWSRSLAYPSRSPKKAQRSPAATTIIS